MGHLLLVVENRIQAANSGCGLDRTHRTDHMVNYWWPELGHEVLSSQRFDFVVISSRARLLKSDMEVLRGLEGPATTIIWL